MHTYKDIANANKDTSNPKYSNTNMPNIRLMQIKQCTHTKISPMQTKIHPTPNRTTQICHTNILLNRVRNNRKKTKLTTLNLKQTQQFKLMKENSHFGECRLCRARVADVLF